MSSDMEVRGFVCEGGIPCIYTIHIYKHGCGHGEARGGHVGMWNMLWKREIPSHVHDMDMELKRVGCE